MVLRDAQTVTIENGQVVLGGSMAAACCAEVAAVGNGIVLPDTCARLIHPAEVRQGQHVALAGGLVKPAGGFGGILCHSLTVFVEHAEIVLRLGQSLLGGLSVPLSGLVIVFLRVVDDAQTHLGFGVALLGGFDELRVLRRGRGGAGRQDGQGQGGDDSCWVHRRGR